MTNPATLLEKRIERLGSEAADCDAQCREIEHRLVQYRQEKQGKLAAVRELKAVLAEITGLSGKAGEPAKGETHNADAGQMKPAPAILRLLEDHPAGLTSATIIDELIDKVKSSAINKKNTFHTTLDNLKKRGQIKHDEQTGKYRLAKVG